MQGSGRGCVPIKFCLWAWKCECCVTYSSFDFFQLFKNVKTVPNSWATQKQMAGQICQPCSKRASENVADPKPGSCLPLTGWMSSCPEVTSFCCYQVTDWTRILSSGFACQLPAKQMQTHTPQFAVQKRFPCGSVNL